MLHSSPQISLGQDAVASESITDNSSELNKNFPVPVDGTRMTRNLYFYVRNRAANNIDPSGMEENGVGKIVGGIFNFVGNLGEGVVQNVGGLVTLHQSPATVFRVVLDLPFDVASGDMFDSSNYDRFTNLPKGTNEVLITINGIFNTKKDGDVIRRSIHSFPGVPTNGSVAVRNETHPQFKFRGNYTGVGDLTAEVLPNELGLIDGVAVRAANQIIMGYNALKRSGAKSPTIRVVAHSQGGMVLQRALDYIAGQPRGKEVLAVTAVYTDGAERFISNQRGLKSVANFVSRDDPVPMIGNPTIARQLEDSVAGYKSYNIVVVPGMEATKTSPWLPHNWDLNYAKIYASPTDLNDFSTGTAPGSQVMTLEDYFKMKKNNKAKVPNGQ